MVLEHLPKTKTDALEAGSVCYFTGAACKNGHIARRYTSTGVCYGCKAEQTKRDCRAHKERVAVCAKNTYARRRDVVIADSKRWAENNRLKSNGYKEKWKKRNREKYLQQAKEYHKQRRADPTQKLSMNTSKGIWDSLKKMKGGRHWESLVSFTLGDLVARLENRFTKTMTWKNYGTYWELDHIKPVSLCSTFEEAWNLSNLQPLECSKNRSKCNRYIG